MKLPSSDAAAREVPEDRSHRVMLPGTTLEVLTERTREQWQRKRWSQHFAECATRFQSA